VPHGLSGIVTNLTCDKLTMKIVWSSFIHTFMHWKHVWHTDKCVDKWNTNLWMNECHTNFTSSNKSMSQMCDQCIILINETYELWLNKFCMIFIIKS
jgi:hypothetical protein